MPIIAKIKPNNISFETIDDANMTHNNLPSYLAPYIEFVSISNDNEKFMEDIARLIIDTDDTNTGPITIQSYKCHESFDSMIYLVTVLNPPKSSSELEKQQQNMLCRYINECFSEVYGNCILFKLTCSSKVPRAVEQVTNTQIQQPAQQPTDIIGTMSDITIRNIIDIYLSKLVHTAVMITPNNSISTISFSRIPIENSPIIEANCRCVNIEFLGKTIVMFMELNPTDDNINTYATIIGKKQKIMGNVVIALMSQVNTFENCNLDNELMHKILVVMSNHSISRELDLNDEFDPNKLNFYRLLDERYKKCSGDICENIPSDVLNGYTYNSTLA
jgi:hypothetical protein